MARKAFFWIVTAALAMLAAEGIAHVYHYAAYGEFYAREQLKYDPHAHDDFTTTSVTHPYFGFTTPWVHHPLNNMPPLLAHDGTLVVGVFGGSVAQQVLHAFRERLGTLLIEEDLAIVPIVVELAQGGMKQPQQAHALAYMLAAGGEFDLVVNLDGHNDVVAPQHNAQRGLFPAYPHLWDKRIGATKADRSLLGRVVLLEREREELVAAGGGMLGSTAVVGLVLRRLLENIDERIRSLHEQLMGQAQRYDVETHGPRWAWYHRGQGEHEAAVRELAVEVWYRSSLVMANLAATAGADYFHFLQPSQYIADSKPLNVEELATAYLPGWHERNYAEAYPRMAAFGARLRQAGVNFVDLTQTFADVAETIYVDTCCHVNLRGAQLLAERMVDAVKPAVRRRANALAESRRSILAAARRPAHADTLVAEDRYDVLLRDGKWLVYRREGCAPEDTRAPFFLHVVPRDPEMLPEERKAAGYDNLDFSFTHFGAVTADGACVAQAWLPGYAIKRIRTGQADARGQLWEVQFDTPPLRTFAALLDEEATSAP